MKATRRSLVLITLGLGLVGAAHAEQARVTAARKKLDAVEAGLAGMKPGQTAEANTLIRKVNAAKDDLKRCAKRNTPAWIKEANRANGLDPKIRARLSGKDGTPVEPDAATKKAAALIAEVRTALTSLTPGDVPTGNTLIRKLNDSRTQLGRSSLRQTALWKDSKAAASELDQAIRKRLKEKPSAAPKPAGTDAAGGAPPAGAAAGGATSGGSTPAKAAAATAAAAAAPKLPSAKRYYFEKDFEKPFKSYSKEMARLPLSQMALPYKVKNYRGAIERMRKAVDKVGLPEHPRVAAAYRQLDAFAADVEARHQEATAAKAAAAAAAAKTAAEVDVELKKIEAIFDPETFRCDLEPPFTSVRLQEWVAQLKEYDKMQAAGIKSLDKIAADYPAYAKDRRVKSLRYLFTKRLPDMLRKGIHKTTGWYEVSGGKAQGVMLHHIARAERFLDPEFLTDTRLANDKLVEEGLKELDEAVQATRALLYFKKEYRGEEDPELAAKIPAMKAALEKLKVGARRVLEASRFPEAVSDDPELIQIAKETAAKAGWPESKYPRMVINYGKTRKEETKSEAKIEGGYLKTRTWTETWDEFQVCRAEEIDGETRLVFYKPKFRHRGASWQKVGSWYIAGRIVSRLILPENIEK